MACGLIKTVRDLRSGTEQDWDAWCDKLLDFCCETDQDRVSSRDEYCYAWLNCFGFLRKHLPNDIDQDISLLFEYMLPLCNGRRADVVMLTAGRVVVLEFKATQAHQDDDLRQLAGYMDYFRTGHKVTIRRQMPVAGYLVRTRDDDGHAGQDDVLDRASFSAAIQGLIGGDKAADGAFELEWNRSATVYDQYALARIDELVREGVRPEFKYLLDDGDIGRSLDKAERLIAEAKDEGRKIVVMVDGTPGSGKTYLGMKIAYDHKTDNPPAAYVSGNGPLVKFLKRVFSTAGLGTGGAQSDGAFILAMADVKRSCYRNEVPLEQGIIVFDEAQRAWNLEQMRKRGYDCSEVECLLRIGDRIAADHGFCVLLCLFGTGQAIYQGEEDGLKLWQQGMAGHQDWTFHASPGIAGQLGEAHNLKADDSLHLSATMRSGCVDVSGWVRALLDNKDQAELKRQYRTVTKQGFEMRLVKDLAMLRKLAPDPRKETGTYGMVMSSMASRKSRSLVESLKIAEIAAYHKSTTEKVVHGWFTGECRKLESYVSEFMCQGLELDWPIVIFGGDFGCSDGVWGPDLKSADGTRRYDDPGQIVCNIYYVLLTRGRRGMILVIPKGWDLDETCEAFVHMGIKEATPQEIWEMLQQSGGARCAE